MKEQKQKEDDKKVLTDHFIGTLPPLLNKVKNKIQSKEKKTTTSVLSFVVHC